MIYSLFKYFQIQKEDTAEKAAVAATAGQPVLILDRTPETKGTTLGRTAENCS